MNFFYLPSILTSLQKEKSTGILDTSRPRASALDSSSAIVKS